MSEYDKPTLTMTFVFGNAEEKFEAPVNFQDLPLSI